MPTAIQSETFCYYISSPDAIDIALLGINNLYDDHDHGVSVDAKSYVVHPEYDESTLKNDIALVRLVEPVEFSDYVRPVCLATSSNETADYRRCWIAGWGTTSYGGEFVILIFSLLKVCA